MALKRVIEAPSYREASIAAGAERQQYGTDAGRQRGGSAAQKRFTSHEREAHLNHRPSNGAIGPTALEDLIGHLVTAESSPGFIGRAPRHGARDATQLTHEERRLVAGLSSGRAEKIAEVARKLKETAVDLPAQAGLPPMTNLVLDALNKYGKGGGHGGGGRAGGGVVGEGGGGPGYGFDPSYLPMSRLGPAGFTVGGRTVTGGGRGGGGGEGGGGGFASGFMGSGYLPQGRGGAMDPKSPSGRSLGLGAAGAGGYGVPSWDPRSGQSDMFGDGYSGRGGVPGARPDALFRARTWRAFNPAGAVTEDPRKPGDGGSDGGSGGSDSGTSTPAPTQPTSPTQPTQPAQPAQPATPQTPTQPTITMTEPYRQSKGDVWWNAGAVGLGAAAGIGAGAATRNLGVGVIVGLVVTGAALAAVHHWRHRPADDGTGPAGPRSRMLGQRANWLRPADDTGGPVLPRSRQLGRGLLTFRPADDDSGPVGPRSYGAAGSINSASEQVERDVRPGRLVYKPNPDDPRPGGPS